METPQTLPIRDVKSWYPARFTLGAATGHQKTAVGNEYSVLVLNVPIQNHALFLQICRKAKWRACADGGANRVKDLGLSADEEKDCHVDLICGDFDSVKSDVLLYYGQKGAAIVERKDQDSTDLMKCLGRLEEIHVAQNLSERIDVAVFGGLEGRADQALSLLHQLYLSGSSKSSNAGDLYMITSTSMIILLKRGLNKIYTPVRDGFFTMNAGIVPLAGPVTLTTRGFEWNLDNDTLRFGHFISTSNHILEETVEVDTTEPIIFTLEFA